MRKLSYDLHPHHSQKEVSREGNQTLNAHIKKSQLYYWGKI